jgi:hypothetical protein
MAELIDPEWAKVLPKIAGRDVEVRVDVLG